MEVNIVPQAMVLTEGMKGCGGCHKIGIKTEDDIKLIKKNSPGFGTASCDSCHVMAEAIRIIAALYKDGVLAKPESYEFPFPDLLTFHDAPTPIEQKLFVMFFEHRMRISTLNSWHLPRPLPGRRGDRISCVGAKRPSFGIQLH
jgi:hypothetical protein